MHEHGVAIVVIGIVELLLLASLSAVVLMPSVIGWRLSVRSIQPAHAPWTASGQ